MKIEEIDLIGKLKSKNQVLESRVKDLQDEVVRLKSVFSVYEKASRERLKVIPFALPSKSQSSNRVIAFSMLSDTHFDERVSPQEVMNLNCYNREIALLRLQMFHDNLIKLIKDYIAGVKYDGLILALGGDMLSGNIHQELRETNEDTILNSIIFWSSQVSSMIKSLSNKLKIPISVPCVVGNHGRGTEKPKYKNYVFENFDYLLYYLIKKDLMSVKNVTVSISDSTDMLLQIYDTNVLLTHGDQFKGGSGISGLLSPLMIGSYRKVKRMQEAGMPFDYLAIGHFHEMNIFKHVLVNGSLKGLDEYAFRHNTPYEEPRQLFAIFDPKHKLTITAPIFCRNPKEVWR
jgi:predicted phosphodiesterase